MEIKKSRFEARKTPSSTLPDRPAKVVASETDA
jgi:hypothetical protein